MPSVATNVPLLLTIPALYLGWRWFVSYRGDKFIRCASVTLMVLVVTFAVFRIPNVPSWVSGSLLFLLGVLSFLSIGFLLQQAYQALRHRKAR